MSGVPSRRRHPPAVYRRRRAVVLILVGALVSVAVWLIIDQPWRTDAVVASAPTVSASASTTVLPVPSPTAQPSVSETPPPTAADDTPPPEPTPSATAASACISENVTVDAVTDQSTYPSGQNPKLSIRLTNHGASECALNVGTTGQVLTITSGSDTWWRSTDCQTEPSDMVVLIAAGQTVSSAVPVEWDRTRSAVATCGGDRPQAPGGGASYHLEVSIGGIESTSSAQFLLF